MVIIKHLQSKTASCFYVLPHILFLLFINIHQARAGGPISDPAAIDEQAEAFRQGAGYTSAQGAVSIGDLVGDIILAFIYLDCLIAKPEFHQGTVYGPCTGSLGPAKHFQLMPLSVKDLTEEQVKFTTRHYFETGFLYYNTYLDEKFIDQEIEFMKKAEGLGLLPKGSVTKKIFRVLK